MATTDQAMVWTCRLALAVSDQGVQEIEDVLQEAMAVPGGPSLLITTMAGTISSLMAEQTGTNWREAIQATLSELQRS